MGNQIGGAITAQVTPIIAAHFGWAMPFLVAAGLCALGGFLWLTVDVERGLAQLGGIRAITPQTSGVQND